MIINLNYLDYILGLSALALIIIAIVNFAKIGECKNDEQCKSKTNSDLSLWYGIVGTIFGLSLLSKLF